ncbi:hypothetical protein GQ53DRAFT_743474 [Thozetella sp. PMI_491]|nr:hypothetical protein GQ53DRAFT_743474 [Thozetella sp. PMI_491]
MKSPSLLADLLLLAGLASAAATPHAQALVRRQQIDQYHITLCENKDYGGRCARIQAAWDICYTMIQENNNWASSAKADDGGKCVVYQNDRCQGASVTVTPSGITDLYPIGFDNNISSFKCGA